MIIVMRIKVCSYTRPFHSVGNGVIFLPSKHFKRCARMLLCSNLTGFRSKARAVAVAIANNPQSFTPFCLLVSVLALHRSEICWILRFLCLCLLTCGESQIF